MEHGRKIACIRPESPGAMAELFVCVRYGIPAYNAAGVLRRAVDSVMEQTVEYARSSLWTMVPPMVRQIWRIRWRQNMRAGLHGFSIPTGKTTEYPPPTSWESLFAGVNSTFLDADDEWLPENWTPNYGCSRSRPPLGWCAPSLI